jgi:F420-dependent oxidoreductase-like protein
MPALVVTEVAEALAALGAGASVVLVADPDVAAGAREAATALPGAPGRLAVMIGDPGDEGTRAAARAMAEELFARSSAEGGGGPVGTGRLARSQHGGGPAPPTTGGTMQISMALSYDKGFKESAARVTELEQAGLDLVWVAEAYGFDGVSLMGYLAAKTERVQIASGILNIYSRTPTLMAMTAAGVDALSDGRFHLGLGASGPQVIEGWHGVRYDAPIGRTREIIEICRKVWAREAPLTHDGRHYHLPLPEGEGTGLGKPLKIIAHPVRPRIPVWVASLGEKNVAMTAEVADGWLPILFIPEKAKDVWGDSLAAGAAKRDPELGPLQISAGTMLAIGEGEDVIALRELARPMVALYVGGMGAKGRNFYNTLARRYGYEQEAEEIQDLYLAGRKKEAEAKVPDEMLELTALVGPRSYVEERVAAMREAGVTHLQVTPIPTGDQTAAELIGELATIAKS